MHTELKHITPEQELEVMRSASTRMLKEFVKLRKEIDHIYGELEIMANEGLVRDIEESREQMKRGELKDWSHFKEIINKG